MTIKAGDWVICVTSCGLDANGRSPTPTMAYRVLKADSLWVYPEGFVDGWRIESFRKVEGFEAGDYVRCIRSSPASPALEPGALYEVDHVVGERIFLKGIVHPSGFFAHRFNLMRRPSKKFGDLTNAEIPVSTTVDWESRFKNLRDASDRLVSENMYLRKELAAERSTKHINPKYVEDLESFRTAVHHVVERKPNGESGVEACQRIVAENADLRDKLTALRTAYETLVNSLKVSPSVFDEHKRMKRQLELAESYNFDRKGLKDDETIRDLYNYVLVALGKKPLTLTEWILKNISAVVGKAMKKQFATAPQVWKVPVVDGARYEGFWDGAFRYSYLWHRPLHYIPISFTINDCQDEKAPNPTGCAEGCSHPDCKKDIK